MDTVRWVLSFAIYLAMVALCIFRFDLAGVAGLAGSALGFLVRVWAPGQDSVSERLGNGYVGLLLGICVGFAGGAIVQYFWPHLALLAR
ncbi:MAG TPA: hypothetical protein VG841_02010 [Caulobacterales bacterium]|nr:hypothetical protein [Caulobacterales bacterium]